MRLCSIASGSSGNCIYIGHASTHLLIDAGISGKRIEEGLKSIGVAPEELAGILITHEHSDHIQGVGVLARKYKVPLYGTVETFCAMKKGKTNIQKEHPPKRMLFFSCNYTSSMIAISAASPRRAPRRVTRV